MILTVLLNLFGIGRLLSGLVFLSSEVLRGEIWRVVTYGLVNPMSNACRLGIS